MLAYFHAVRAVARVIGDAINGSVEALRDGRVEHEPAMTDRMLGRIEESVNGFRHNGIRWGAKTLTDRAQGSQERIYGADFMGVLNIDLPGFKVSKGFLAQAKLLRNETVDDLSRLREQCRKMLHLSPDSFVFFYSIWGVYVVPAVSIVGCSEDPMHLYRRSAQRFFEEHLQCFIGDHNIQAPTPKTLSDLEGMRDRFRVRDILLLGGEAD